MDEESILNQKYLDLCRQYGLNPSMLKEIIYYRSLGYNNEVIAKKIGTTRQTVHNYTNKLQLMERSDVATIIFAALVGVVGFTLLYSLLKDKK